VNVHVVVPTRLSREQRRLLELLDSSTRVDNTPIERSVFEKARKIFG